MRRPRSSTPSSTFLPRKAHEPLLEKNMKLLRVAGALGLVGFAAVGAQAAIAADSGWYGGLSIGASRAEIDDEGITSGLLGRGFTVNSIADEDSDTGFKLLGGRKFNKN